MKITINWADTLTPEDRAARELEVLRAQTRKLPRPITQLHYRTWYGTQYGAKPDDKPGLPHDCGELSEYHRRALYLAQRSRFGVYTPIRQREQEPARDSANLRVCCWKHRLEDWREWATNP